MLKNQTLSEHQEQEEEEVAAWLQIYVSYECSLDLVSLPLLAGLWSGFINK